MKTFKQIIDESEKRTKRMETSISDSKILNRLGNIANQLDNKTISPEQANDLYNKEAERIKDIKSKLKK